MRRKAALLDMCLLEYGLDGGAGALPKEPHHTRGTCLRLRLLTSTAPPFVRRDFPDVGGHASADVVTLGGADEPHAGLFRDAPRPDIVRGLRDPKDGEGKGVDPVVGYRLDGFRHQAAAAPGRIDPKAAVLTLAALQADAADHRERLAPGPQGPVPLVVAPHGRQRDVADIPQCAIVRV